MVFVSMEQDDLLSRTSAYRFRDESPSPAYYRNPGFLEELPVLDRGTSELLSEDARPTSRRRDEATPGRSIPPPVSNMLNVPPSNSHARPSRRNHRHSTISDYDVAHVYEGTDSTPGNPTEQSAVGCITACGQSRDRMLSM